MAKISKIAKNEQRKKLVEKYRSKRAALRKQSLDLKLTLEERMEARQKLAALPRNSSETRIVNRCELTGRPRAYYRKFGLSRLMLRKLASEGEIPGVRKASW